MAKSICDSCADVAKTRSAARRSYICRACARRLARRVKRLENLIVAYVSHRRYMGSYGCLEGCDVRKRLEAEAARISRKSKP